jgi:hypothetical protein
MGPVAEILETRSLGWRLQQIYLQDLFAKWVPRSCGTNGADHTASLEPKRCYTLDTYSLLVRDLLPQYLAMQCLCNMRAQLVSDPIGSFALAAVVSSLPRSNSNPQGIILATRSRPTSLPRSRLTPFTSMHSSAAGRRACRAPRAALPPRRLPRRRACATAAPLWPARCRPPRPRRTTCRARSPSPPSSAWLPHRRASGGWAQVQAPTARAPCTGPPLR